MSFHWMKLSTFNQGINLKQWWRLHRYEDQNIMVDNNWSLKNNIDNVGSTLQQITLPRSNLPFIVDCVEIYDEIRDQLTTANTISVSYSVIHWIMTWRSSVLQFWVYTFDCIDTTSDKRVRKLILFLCGKSTRLANYFWSRPDEYELHSPMIYLNALKFYSYIDILYE